MRYNTSYALYMEPSTFQYAGLQQQRDGGGYDNFLRSNIDNQQDRRNFEAEDGRDHLPFRSFEARTVDSHGSQKHKIPETFPGRNITATPGQPVIVPLRWNNPHSSELEVNVWIMNNKYVVPIRKPTCSGEGYQDNVINFTIPTNFVNLRDYEGLNDFQGCKKVDDNGADCVLQIYAHSVESRTYAIGTPLIVTGDMAPPSATKKPVEDRGLDPGVDLNNLKHDLCLPSFHADAHIKDAKPRLARHVSDQFNHAYQNSDFSPYSGQQPEAISRNLQASCILKMWPANRGELGKQALLADNKKGFKFQRSLDRKAKKLVKKYEDIANSLIGMFEEAMQRDGPMKNNDTFTAQSHDGAAKYQEVGWVATMVNDQRGQQTSWDKPDCFRCAHVGATVNKRLETSTYIPSFEIPASMLDSVNAMKALLSEDYKKMIGENGKVEIYKTAYKDLIEEFKKAETEYNISYMGPMIKMSATTMEDARQFKKRDADGNTDKGVSAARIAYEKAGVPPWGSDRNALTSYTKAYTLQNSQPEGPLLTNWETLGEKYELNVAYAQMLSEDFPIGRDFALPRAQEESSLTLPEKRVTEILEASPQEMAGVLADGSCDDLSTDHSEQPDDVCETMPASLFAMPQDIEYDAEGLPQPYGSQEAMVAASDAFSKQLNFFLAATVCMARLLW